MRVYHSKANANSVFRHAELFRQLIHAINTLVISSLYKICWHQYCRGYLIRFRFFIWANIGVRVPSCRRASIHPIVINARTDKGFMQKEVP